jgi:hypothetical protein
MNSEKINILKCTIVVCFKVHSTFGLSPTESDEKYENINQDWG